MLHREYSDFDQTTCFCFNKANENDINSCTTCNLIN